jgi:hypothetical protein
MREHQGITELRKAAFRRLRDAEALLRAGGEHAHCAMYVAGYAVECKLKAIAMEVHNCVTLEELARRWQVDEREVFTHGLECLARRLTLYSRFVKSGVWRDFSGQVNRWRPSWRYKPGEASVKMNQKADAFLRAVERVCKWLDANRG